MEIYLDNAATTKPYSSVVDKMAQVLSKDYANPSSMHNKGFIAEQYIKEAKKGIAKSLKIDENEIFFTSSGTEANNLALIGTALANKRKGNHIISTSIEHPSVTNPLNYLSENGFNIDFAPVDKNGKLIVEKLLGLINDKTIMISIIYTNNEIGTIQDMERITSLIKEKNKDIIIHSDAVQAYGKININLKKLNIDLLSISGHKIHGPKGIGALYIKKGIKVNPIIFGGGQEAGKRSGTENVPAIAGLLQAIEESFSNIEDTRNHLYKMKLYFISEINKIEDTIINGLGSIEESAAHIVSVGFKNIKSEVLLHALSNENIYVSSGSACSSNQKTISKTLKAIGVSDDYIFSTIRFSFDREIDYKKIDYVVSKLKSLLQVLRKYQAK